ncbi:hypothetical protein [Paenibacillus sp. YYML68]|uniref:hypothetical protein n=1 Tax=Paenibacillus sp. YYML68 TaxID=2909250 RepID=UPI0024939D0D|nr:hypothetical protein [Paenibacillus sp. YYML68]
MYIVATFQYSIELEMAISDLEKKGIASSSIAAVPLDRQKPKAIHVFDTMNHSDGVSLLDGPAVLGTVFAVLGASAGFIWTWGPIIWGLIGLAVGGLLGGLCEALVFRRWKQLKLRRAEEAQDVVVILECQREQAEDVIDLLRDRNAVSIGHWG